MDFIIIQIINHYQYMSDPNVSYFLENLFNYVTYFILYFSFDCNWQMLMLIMIIACWWNVAKLLQISGGGRGCEVSCGGHHQLFRGKTTTGSALDRAVFDSAQILAHLVHNMSRSQICLGFGHFGWLNFSVNRILVGLWLNFTPL